MEITRKCCGASGFLLTSRPTIRTYVVSLFGHNNLMAPTTTTCYMNFLYCNNLSISLAFVFLEIQILINLITFYFIFALYVLCRYTMAIISIKWDPEKAETNKSKHGISFDDAVTVFFDLNGKVINDPDHSDSEDRFLIMGLSWSLNLLVVSHCYRRASAEIRIISARKANKQERKQYGAKR